MMIRFFFFRNLSAAEKWLVPDRQTGLMALQELNPARTWNFVMVNKNMHYTDLGNTCILVI